MMYHFLILVIIIRTFSLYKHSSTLYLKFVYVLHFSVCITLKFKFFYLKKISPQVRLYLSAMHWGKPGLVPRDISSIAPNLGPQQPFSWARRLVGLPLIRAALRGAGRGSRSRSRCWCANPYTI